MNHKYRILECMLNEGKISRQELMNDEITPDQHVERYNELMKMEPQSFGPPELHEHI